MKTSGLVAGTEGNVSARTPEGNLLITPSGLDYAVTEPEDIVVVSLDGTSLEGAFKPSVETPMHTGIYRARPETLDIVHTHARRLVPAEPMPSHSIANRLRVNPSRT
jgi:L-fuculose-phosphate aldolase